MPARVPALALLAAFVFIAAAAAVTVENPADPPGQRQTVTLNETWRAGGDDDEIFFGSVQRVIAGPDRTVLVLDNQQSQVQVYAADGTWLRTLGREGDGPGEVRGASDTFFLPDGRLCVSQSFPGRLVYLNSDGTPGGQAQYKPLGDPITFSVVVEGRSAACGMILIGIRFNQSGGPQAKQTYFVSCCDTEGREQAVYLEKEYAINYADFRLDEARGDFVWAGRLAVDDAGRAYIAPGRDEYLIRVHAPDGTLLREFGRPVTAPERTDEERQTARKIQEAIGANYGVPLQGVTVEDTQRVISNIWVRPDGEIWVETPVNEIPAGAFALLDVFDAEGRYSHQLVLEAPGDPARDTIQILDDGRVALIIGGLDAWLSQQGVEMSSEDAPALEVVLYDAI